MCYIISIQQGVSFVKYGPEGDSVPKCVGEFEEWVIGKEGWAVLSSKVMKPKEIGQPMNIIEQGRRFVVSGSPRVGEL
jgi:hypothetical protein